MRPAAGCVNGYVGAGAREGSAISGRRIQSHAGYGFDVGAGVEHSIDCLYALRQYYVLEVRAMRETRLADSLDAFRQNDALEAVTICETRIFDSLDTFADIEIAEIRTVFETVIEYLGDAVTYMHRANIVAICETTERQSFDIVRNENIGK